MALMRLDQVDELQAGLQTPSTDSLPPPEERKANGTGAECETTLK